MDIQKAIRMAVDTGKVLMGVRESLRSINTGESKLVVIASNAPQDVLVDIKRRAQLAGVPVYVYGGTSMELGSASGRPHPIAVMSILEPGDSNILSVIEG